MTWQQWPLYSCPGSLTCADEVYLYIFTFIQVSPHVVALALCYSPETDVHSQPVTCMKKRETHSTCNQGDRALRQ